MYGPHDFSWVTSEKHCQAKDEIGAGSVGTVYKAVHPTTGQEIAIKRMDRAPLARDATALNGFQREVDMFSRLHHPNIIRLLGVQMEPACHLLIMEQAECELCVPCSLPVLAARVRRRIAHERVCCAWRRAEELQAGAMAEPECRFYFRQIAQAVGYCHSQGICHRDLKLENVLLMPDNVTVKVTDFGMGKNYLMNSGPKTHEVGSFAYMSPEVIAGQGEYQPTPADIWSLGVMLYAMSVCRFPFGCLDSKDRASALEQEQRIRRNVLSADAITSRPNFFGGGEQQQQQQQLISAPLQDLIRKILVVDPSRRITIEAMLSHPWLLDRTGEEEYSMNQHMPMGSPPMQMDPATMAAMAAMDVGGGGGGGGPLAGAAPMAVPMAGGAGGGGIGGLPMPSPPVGGSSLGTVAGRVGYGAASYGSLGTQPSAEMMDVADADGGAGDQAAAAAAAAAPAAAAGGWVAPQYNWDEAPQYQPQSSADSFDFDSGHHDDFFEEGDDIGFQ
jgi:serine/threonine protein kinase